MFKVVKDNKIIGISTDNKVVGLVYDEIIEDTEHSLEDYQYNEDQYLLKSEIPAPTKEEQKEKRAQAYLIEVDPLHSQRQRNMVLGSWTEEDEEEYKLKVQELTNEIQKRFPYPEEEA